MTAMERQTRLDFKVFLALKPFEVEQIAIFVQFSFSLKGRGYSCGYVIFIFEERRCRISYPVILPDTSCLPPKVHTQKVKKFGPKTS